MSKRLIRSTVEFGVGNVYGTDSYGDPGAMFGDIDPASSFGTPEQEGGSDEPAADPIEDPAAAFR